jgi:hypothetical protein
MLKKESEFEKIKQDLLIDEFETQIDEKVEIFEKLAEEKIDIAPVPSAKVEVIKSDKIKNVKVKTEKSKKSKESAPAKIIERPRLEIGEGDMLKTVLDEVPGFDYDQRTLKQLCDKQDKHTLFMTKEQQKYKQQVKNKDNEIEQVRQRQILMSKLKLYFLIFTLTLTDAHVF